MLRCFFFQTVEVTNICRPRQNTAGRRSLWLVHIRCWGRYQLRGVFLQTVTIMSIFFARRICVKPRQTVLFVHFFCVQYMEVAVRGGSCSIMCAEVGPHTPHTVCGKCTGLTWWAGTVPRAEDRWPVRGPCMRRPRPRRPGARAGSGPGPTSPGPPAPSG